jgi:hypothetical protein
MRPLNGSHYVNIFSHYRPVGDPEWYQKTNPPGTPKALLDVGAAAVLTGPGDLFKHWQDTSPAPSLKAKEEYIVDPNGPAKQHFDLLHFDL